MNEMRVLRADHTPGSVRYLKSEVTDAIKKAEHEGHLARLYDDSRIGVYAALSCPNALKLLSGRKALPFDLAREIVVIDHTLQPDQLEGINLVIYRHLFPGLGHIDPEIAHLVDPRNTVVQNGIIRLKERLDVAFVGDRTNGLSKVVSEIERAYEKFRDVTNGNSAGSSNGHGSNGKRYKTRLEIATNQLLLFDN